MAQETIVRSTFYYDPSRQGFDNNEWRTLWGGTPVLNAYRIELPDGGAIIHFWDILKGDIEFEVNFSVAPGSGSAVTTDFGLYEYFSGAFVGFLGRADGLYAKVSDGTNSTTSSAITWESSWTNTTVKFRIIWNAGLVDFWVDGVRKETLSGDYIPHGPLSLYFSDDSSDSTGLGAIRVRGSQGVFQHLVPSNTAAPVLPVFRVIEHEGVTVAETVTIAISSPLVSPFESVTVADVLVNTDSWIQILPEVYDEVTVAEDIVVDIQNEILGIETTTVTEDISVVASDPELSVYDDSTVADEPENTIAWVQGP